jgi:hypothetical protein
MDLGHTELGAPELDIEILRLPEDLLLKLGRVIDRPLTLIIEIDSVLRSEFADSRIDSDFPELEYAELDYAGGLIGSGKPPPITVANRPWLGRPSDSARPHVYYEPRIKKGVTLQRSLPLSPEEPRRSELQIGAIPINVAGDIALAEMITRRNFSGRQTRAYLGPADGDFREYVKIFGVSNRRWRWTSRNVAELDVADIQYKLAQKVQRLFTGRGGINGDPTIKGIPQPQCFGRLFNVPGQRLSQDTRYWWLHPRQIQSVIECRDMGIPLVFMGAFPSFDALRAATLNPGEWAVTLGTLSQPALVRLESEPADSSSIRFDVMGDVHPEDGYTEEIGEILLRLYRDFGYIGQSSIDAASFLSLPPDRAGWYLGTDAQPTVEEISDAILRGIYAWSTTSDRLQFQARSIQHPADGVDQFTLRREDIIKWDAPVSLTSRYAQPVLFKRNWGLLTQAQVADDVTDEFASELTDLNGGHITNKPRGFVLERDDQAIAGETLISPFYDQAPAAALSELILDIHDGQGLIDQVDIGTPAYALSIGKCGRFVFDAGDRGTRAVMIINQRLDIGGRNSLALFG